MSTEEENLIDPVNIEEELKGLDIVHISILFYRMMKETPKTIADRLILTRFSGQN